MNIFKFRKSLTKNWPGGRRNATTIETKDTWSYPVFDTRQASLKAEWDNGIRKPYTAPRPPKKEDGGMADVSTETTDTTGPSTN